MDGYVYVWPTGRNHYFIRPDRALHSGATGRLRAPGRGANVAKTFEESPVLKLSLNLTSCIVAVSLISACGNEPEFSKSVLPHWSARHGTTEPGTPDRVVTR